MNNDWQSWAAAGVVTVTAAAFLVRAMKRRKKAAGCNTCGSAGPQPRLKGR